MSRSSGDNVINNAEWQAIQGDLELWWNLLFADLLLESLVGGEQAGGGLVPVFLHHLGHDRLVDSSPGVESQVAGSLAHRSANHLLHLFLKHLVVMAVLLAIVPHGGLLSHSKDTLTSHPSAHSWHLKNFFVPSVLMYIMTKLSPGGPAV